MPGSPARHRPESSSRSGSTRIGRSVTILPLTRDAPVADHLLDVAPRGNAGAGQDLLNSRHHAHTTNQNVQPTPNDQDCVCVR